MKNDPKKKEKHKCCIGNYEGMQWGMERAGAAAMFQRS